MPACLLDVGVWLAAGFAAHPAHGAARRVLDMDAYLAAFAMAAGVLLVSLDRDFSHFEQQGLKFQLLLADGSGCKSA